MMEIDLDSVEAAVRDHAMGQSTMGWALLDALLGWLEVEAFSNSDDKARAEALVAELRKSVSPAEEVRRMSEALSDAVAKAQAGARAVEEVMEKRKASPNSVELLNDLLGLLKAFLAEATRAKVLRRRLDAAQVRA